MKNASSMMARLFQPPRKIAFTREGLLLILFTFPLGLAAINTGNNMLYLILGMLLSVIALNGVFSESSIKKITVSGRLPPSVFAGEALTSFVEARNNKRLLPTYLVRIRHLWLEAMSEKFLTFRRKSESGPIKSDEGYLIKLSAGNTQKIRLVTHFETRGIYTLKGYRLATLFPFGLFDKLRELSLDTEKEKQVVVYPKPLKTDLREFSPWLHVGDLDMNVRGFGGDLYALREYQASDDARFIHWKLSAKIGHPIVREQAATGKKRLLIGFDTRGHMKAAVKNSDSLFETAVSQIAYLVLEALRKEIQFGLVTPEKRFATLAGEDHFHEVMRYLATVKPLPASAPAENLQALQELAADEVLLFRPLAGKAEGDPVHSAKRGVESAGIRP